MPRKTRIDAPSAIHHIVIRGIERRRIFRNFADRNNFTERLGKIMSDTQTACLGWALIPNHSSLVANRPRTLANCHASALDRIRCFIQPQIPSSRVFISKPIQIHFVPGGSLSERPGSVYPFKSPAGPVGVEHESSG